MVQGEIDLSIGSVYLFCPFMFYEFNQAGLPLVPCLIAALVMCAGVGLLNGVITEVFGVSSFITTLGMLLALAGLTLIISHAAPVEMPGAEVTSKVVNVHHMVNGQDIVLPERVNEVGTFATIFGAGKYSELIWALIIVAAVQVAADDDALGHVHDRRRRQQARRRRGGREGAHRRDPQLRRSAASSPASSGILEATRSGSVTPDTAGAAETMFRAVSAAVIGGTLLAGGQGTAIGALFGALFLGVLRDGLVLEGVNADYLDFILGVAILVAMIINVYVGRVRRGSGV